MERNLLAHFAFISIVWSSTFHCADVYAQLPPDMNPRYWQIDDLKSDEFNGAELDTSKWWQTDACSFTDSIRHGFNGEGAFFKPEHVTVSNGNLILKIDYNPDSSDLSFPCLHYHLYPFCSGGIQSKQTNGGSGVGGIGNFSFGYYEMRAKLPGYYDAQHQSTGYGFWPAFWFAYGYRENTCIKKHDEVDVLEPGPTEYYDAKTNVVGWHDEYDSCNAHKVGQDSVRCTDPLFENYHTYSVQLLPEKIIFYFDHEPFYSADTISTPGIAHSLNMSSYMSANISVQMGGYARPRPLPDAPFPQFMYVDYFRYYQFAPEEINQNVLYQNNPNPFTGSTEIEYSTDSNSENAFITIFSLFNLPLKSIQLTEKGKSKITLSISGFIPGIYFYQLVVDNKIIATRKMIILK